MALQSGSGEDHDEPVAGLSQYLSPAITAEAATAYGGHALTWAALAEVSLLLGHRGWLQHAVLLPPNHKIVKALRIGVVLWQPCLLVRQAYA